LSAGCPTVVTITPSTGTFEVGDELTCSADGYDPTYMWTDADGYYWYRYLYYLHEEGPFNVTCTAIVSQLPAPCHASATVSDIALHLPGKYEKQETQLPKRNSASASYVYLGWLTACAMHRTPQMYNSI